MHHDDVLLKSNELSESICVLVPLKIDFVHVLLFTKIVNSSQTYNYFLLSSCLQIIALSGRQCLADNCLFARLRPWRYWHPALRRRTSTKIDDKTAYCWVTLAQITGNSPSPSQDSGSCLDPGGTVMVTPSCFALNNDPGSPQNACDIICCWGDHPAYAFLEETCDLKWCSRPSSKEENLWRYDIWGSQLLTTKISTAFVEVWIVWLENAQSPTPLNRKLLLLFALLAK